MPTSEDIARVADQIRQRLNGLAYLTIGRCEVTDNLRQVSGEPGTRFKSKLARQLDNRLLELGIFALPRFQDTTTGAVIRLYHVGTEASRIADIILHPSATTDTLFAEIITKVQGKWQWNWENGLFPSSGPAGTPVAPISAINGPPNPTAF